jgi:hypothetical protein
MTKYILNSGRATSSTDRGRKFFDEVFKGLGRNPKLLVCYFAKAREGEFKIFKI